MSAPRHGRRPRSRAGAALVAVGAAAAAALVASCGPPEQRAAKQYLKCAASRDLQCLRRLSAPMVPRLHSWAAAPNADPLFVGAFARQVMIDADNPFGAFSPGSCAQAGQANQLDAAVKKTLGSCDCKLGAQRRLPPADERMKAFEPHRVRAQKTHPAMEVLANRTTAESKRVTTLSQVHCSCDGRAIDSLVLDLPGRDPAFRVFHVTGACGPAAPLEPVLARTEALLRGELTSTKTRLPAKPGGDKGAALAPAPPPIPDTPTGRELKSVLATLAQNGETPTDDALRLQFSARFLAQVPPERLRATYAQLRGRIAPFVLEKLSGGSERLTAVLRSQSGGRTRLVIATEAKPPHAIDTLFLSPLSQAKPLRSWDEAKTALLKQAADVTYLAAELGPKGCAPLAAHAPDKPMGIGSAFKLYILAALADEVAASKRRWTNPLAIRDDWKSLPSGVLQLEPAGKKLPLRAYAEKMISRSDNTATDHLLFALGRDAVEAAVKKSGHARPDLLQPFLSTREFFALKLAQKADASGFLAASPAERRKRLAAIGKLELDPMLLGAMGWMTPVLVDRLEWFASHEDLCKLAASFDLSSGRTSEVGRILALNPGVADEEGAFSYVGFKGGSEPGVLHMTWVLHRKRDQKRLFFSVSFNDTKKPIPEEASALAASARALLGR